MKQQGGCIGVEGENWFLRWRESINGVRKLRYKVLGPVTADHRRNKDRSTGKLRIPPEIQEQADAILAAANGNGPDKAMLSLAGMVMQTSPELAQKLAGNGKVSKLEIANSLRELMERPQDRRRISEVATDYFTEHEPQLSNASVLVYRYAWGILKGKIENRVLADYTRADAFRLWQEIRNERPDLRRHTFNVLRGFLGGLFIWSANRGLFTGENPATADLPANIPGARETRAYKVNEVRLMLTEIFSNSPRIQAIIAIAFGGGLRESEISGLEWTDYERTDTDAILHVHRRAYRGNIGKTKTKGSTGDVHLGGAFAQFVDAYRASIGNPTEGLIFSYRGTPVSMDGIARVHIRPFLNYCSVCAQKKTGIAGYGSRGTHVDSPDELGQDSKLADHLYQPRSAVLPDWIGWHGFRRGNATYLAGLQSEAAVKGISPDELAALQLRHSNVSTTQNHYIKGRTKQDIRIARARKVIEIDEHRGMAAGALSEGLTKQVQ